MLVIPRNVRPLIGNPGSTGRQRRTVTKFVEFMEKELVPAVLSPSVKAKVRRAIKEKLTLYKLSGLP